MVERQQQSADTPAGVGPAPQVEEFLVLPTPSPGPAGAETTALSPMEEQRQRASVYRSDLSAIAARADRIDANYRRYLDGCYQKYTRTDSSGSSYGTASSSSSGAAVATNGHEWAGAVFSGTSQVAWRQSWEGQSMTANDGTAPCRILWSDIVSDSNNVRGAMAAMAEDARRRGVIPGVMRELLAEYRLVSDWW